MTKYKTHICALMLVATILSATAQSAFGQGYIKLNGLYAMAGVINPSAEFRLTQHTTFQTEVVLSPWNKLPTTNKPMRFGIFMNEFRRYFRKANDGWYVGLNGSMMGFKMSKPYLDGWSIRLKDSVAKGYGLMAGVSAGWERRFAKRWIVDVYGGWAYMLSWYNGYSTNGEIDLYPHRDQQPPHPDPFNGSAEWYPNKLGISIGLLIF